MTNVVVIFGSFRFDLYRVSVQRTSHSIMCLAYHVNLQTKLLLYTYVDLKLYTFWYSRHNLDYIYRNYLNPLFLKLET